MVLTEILADAQTVRAPLDAPVALQSIDRFVARTMNWFYDHMRFVPRHRPVVVCRHLENRVEFPKLQAIGHDPARLGPRIWNRLTTDQLYPLDAAELRATRPEVLHSHLGYVALDDHRLVHTMGLPWVVSFYGADVYLFRRDPAKVAAYQPVFARARRVLSLGPAMSAALAGMGCPPEKIAIHPLGVDALSLPPVPRTRAPNEPIRILFAGTFREKKGARYLVEAAGLLRQRGVPFTLTLVGDAAGREGDRACKEEILGLIASHHLEGVTTRHSWLSYEALMRLGLESHVFVAPSVTAADGDAEGTPAVIGQMMATAMPIVATSHSDIPFTFGPYADRLLPERDSTAIADRLQSYYEEPDSMRVDGQQYRDQILKTFDTRDCAAELSTLYEAL